MKLFLCGGGSGLQTQNAYRKFNDVIDHNKPILYISLAMQSNRYDSCYEWISNELKNVDVPRIDMVRSADELANKNLDDYGALFIGGGNTYKLLKDLKDSGAFEKIKEYIENDGVIFGGSAGAIIFGECIDTCKYADKNDVCLEDQMGFNAFNYFSILCHFTNQNEEKTEINKKYLQELSNKKKIIALPEEDTIYYDDGKFKVIGNRPYYIFEKGNIIVYNSNKNRNDEFNMVSTPDELMDFMNQNITYGWVDKFENKHLNNLKDFRENYRISSINEMLEAGLGTCIEQAKMIKFFFDKMDIENKLYCYRSYETEENFDKEVLMHCFVLFKYDDNWYHFEHSDMHKKGIHKYESVSDAIADITSYYEKKYDIRKLTKIDSVPDELTFKEFNLYVNEFDNKKKKTI